MFWDNIILWSRGLGFVASAGLFWIQYFDLKDYLNPEPRRMLVMSFLFGAIAAGIALGFYRLLESFGAPEDPGNTPISILLYCIFIVGVIEEGTKFAAARLTVFRTLHFDEPIDGLIYSSAISVGFASVESLLYTPLMEWPYQLARAVTAPLTHSLFAAIWGFGTAYAFFHARNKKHRFLWQFSSLTAAIIVHGFYDFVLLAKNATYSASIIALLLWIILIWRARTTVLTAKKQGNIT